MCQEDYAYSDFILSILPFFDRFLPPNYPVLGLETMKTMIVGQKVWACKLFSGPGCENDDFFNVFHEKT